MRQKDLVVGEEYAIARSGDELERTLRFGTGRRVRYVGPVEVQPYPWKNPVVKAGYVGLHPDTGDEIHGEVQTVPFAQVRMTWAEWRTKYVQRAEAKAAKLATHEAEAKAAATRLADAMVAIGIEPEPYSNRVVSHASQTDWRLDVENLRPEAVAKITEALEDAAR